MSDENDTAAGFLGNPQVFRRRNPRLFWGGRYSLWLFFFCAPFFWGKGGGGVGLFRFVFVSHLVLLPVLSLVFRSL